MSLEPHTTSLQPPPSGELGAHGNGAAATGDAAATPADLQQISANSQKISALHADVFRLVDQIDRWNGRSGGMALPTPGLTIPSDSATALGQQSAQIAAMTATVRELEARFRGLENLSLVAPRKPMGVRLVELLIGPEFYVPWRRQPAVPGVTIVIPASSDVSDASVAATLRSVLRQSHAGWEAVVVGVEPGPLLQAALAAGAGRARHVLEIAPIHECLNKGLSSAVLDGSSAVLGIVHPGQQLEPTAASAVMRFFRDHPHAAVAYFEQTVHRGGWRMPLPRPKRMDVYALLAEPGCDGWWHGGVFFRRRALGMVGGYKPQMQSAAEWHLYLRLARMFGLRRGSGQVLSIDAGEAANSPRGTPADFERARQEFLGNFGIAGRVRCRIIYAIHRIADQLELAAESRPPDAPPAENDAANIDVEAAKCPLTGEAADRLLFSAAGADGTMHYVYECSGGVGAMVTPSSRAAPVDHPLHDELLDRLLSRIPPENTAIRALVVEDSARSASMASRTKWNVTTWPGEVALSEAALVLAEEQRFDVIWAGAAIRHAADPAGMLRSLRSVLAPGAILAFALPNFNSRLCRGSGARWSGWDVPNHPMIFSRRGVRELARLSDLRIQWMHSRANANSPRAGASRWFWEWRGQGDEWLVLLQAE